MIVTPLFVIFLIFVFILVWIFASTIDKRKWVGFSISIIATPIVYMYVFYPFINIFFSYHHQKHFDAEDWNEKPALRYEMSTEIVHQNLFLGKTKAEVKKALGKSEWYGWDNSVKASSPEKWNYNLGFKPGAFNMTQECLELVFENDEVKHISQYQMKKKFD